MAKTPSFWGEQELPKDFDPMFNFEQFKSRAEADKLRRKRIRRRDAENEVGVIATIPPEILEKRARYSADYTLIHPELFTNSSGIKPLSEAQKDSVRHSQYFAQHGTHVIKCEPRGFGKTSRSTNEGLYAVLEGSIKYLVLVASNTEKAEEIITSIMAELFSNDKLLELYPRTIACFRHVEKNPRHALFQTYEGEPTYLYYNNGFIVFPYIDGEPSSGAIIDIRARKNVRGIYHTVETGEYAGSRQRPTHAILDDIQTDEEAHNPNTARKIINLIKRSIMKAGSHSKGISIMMNGTPIAPGDVTHHFLFNEPWQHMLYRMLESRSVNEHMWFGTYQDIITDFDKKIPGSLLKAKRKALEFYKIHQEEMDKGAIAAWEWCYEWDAPIPTEISAIQHAYNIMILEGMDVFEAECQCNVAQYEIDTSITYCTAEEIANSINDRPRYKPQVKDKHIVTHIDLNKPYLSYVTMSCPDYFEPSIIDYGTYPSYPIFPSKDKAPYTLRTMLSAEHGPDINDEDISYLSVRDFIREMASRRYKREDGVELANHLILVDSRYHTEWVYKAIRDSNVPYAHPAQGQSFKAKDKTIAQMKYSEACIKYHHAVLTPTDDRTLMRLTTDINYMKTQVHIAFSKPAQTAGSITLFLPETVSGHIVVGKHCVAEQPLKDIDPKTGREITIWENRPGGGDNELFDNIVGCLGALAMRRVEFRTQSGNQNQTFNMADFIKGQKK